MVTDLVTRGAIVARSQLHALIRFADASHACGSDAELLDRFAGTSEQGAFAELVRRYARLVWGQCHHLLANEADADDAFQATFLALAKSAGSIRHGDRLGPWLHAVAHRVCLNARRAAVRRKKRERCAAAVEGDAPVADSTWDCAAAALHEEVARLPESLRVPFVLCCLEGLAPTVAAGRLGLKWGTFSARLSRSKQRLVDRLTARGLGVALVAGTAGGGSVASAAVVARTVSICAGGASVPAAVLSLSKGVGAMFLLRTKLSVVLAAAMAAAGAATLVGPTESLPAAIPAAHAAPVPVPSVEVKTKKLEELWKLLGAHDEAVSARALLELSSRPKASVVAFFAEKLKPLKLTEERAKKLVADLGEEKEGVAEAAFKEMQYFDPRLVLEVGDMLQNLPDGLHRQRLAALLSNRSIDGYVGYKIEYSSAAAQKAVNGGEPAVGNFHIEDLPGNPRGKMAKYATAVAETPAELSQYQWSTEWGRSTRAVMILEHLGTPDAVKVLETMATGHKDASPTRAATEALERLKKR